MTYGRDHYEALIHRYFLAVDEERIEDVLDCFTADGQMQFAFMDAPARGRDELRAMFATHIACFRTHVDVATRVVVQGDRAISEIVFDAELPGGSPVHLENCNVYRFRDGKFDVVKVYLDTVTMARQLAGA
jgi:ketosteroid isomerase-like protein